MLVTSATTAVIWWWCFTVFMPSCHSVLAGARTAALSDFSSSTITASPHRRPITVLLLLQPAKLIRPGAEAHLLSLPYSMVILLLLLLSFPCPLVKSLDVQSYFIFPFILIFHICSKVQVFFLVFYCRLSNTAVGFSVHVRQQCGLLYIRWLWWTSGGPHTSVPPTHKNTDVLEENNVTWKFICHVF